MYEQSHRDYLLRSPHMSSSALSWAVNHYRDNAITYKAQRDKMPENWSWRTRHYWHADASAVFAALDAKYTKELADAKAENDALRDDVAAGRRQFAHQAVCRPVSAYYTTASGVDNAASPRQPDTAEQDYFTLKKLITMQKQLEGTQKYINRPVQIELPISMGNSCNYCEQYTRASSGV